MKKLLLCIAVVAAMIVTGCSRFSNRGEVEMPFIDAANTSSLSFDRVSLSDSATVLNAVVHFRPGNWIRFDSASRIVADGKEYMLESIEGIAPGEEYIMPDSGVAHFIMHFPAIPASVKAIDFTEGTADGWQLWGIQLDPNYTNKGVIASEMTESDPNAVLPEVNMSRDTTTVNIHLLNYRPAMGNKLSYGVNTLTGQISDMPALDIDEKGNAVFKRVIVGPEELFVYRLGTMPMRGTVVMEPGETLDLYCDCRFSGAYNMSVRNNDNIDFSYEFHGSNGRLAEVNRAGYAHNSYGLELYSGKFGGYKMTGGEYCDYVVSKYLSNLDSINALDATPATKEMLKTGLQADVIHAISKAPSILARNYYSENQNWGAKIPDGTINAEISPENARMIAELINLNNPKLFYHYGLTSPDDLSNTDVWVKAGIDTKMLDELKAYQMAFDAASSGELDSESIDILKKSTYPAYAASAAARQKETEELLSSKAAEMIEPTPAVADNKVFDEIIKPYKGKVVVVDLWNTWCGPCRAALAANEPLKTKELASDDIVWIYIADESSPIKNYLEMIPDINGHHFRINKEQKAAINERFDVDGIPYYIVVDRQGKATGRPDLRDHKLYVSTILDMLK